LSANQNVIDELVVKLSLNADEYKKADKIIVQLVDKTESRMKDVDKKRTDRDRKQQKRNQETLKGVKELAQGFKNLALTVGAMLGIGSAAGIVGAVVALANMETGLRRAAVSTGLSNRELQAYGSTMRRLGADAQGGAQAIADLAREQKQFNITGHAPTLQAFARLGIRANAETPISDILAQAQQTYRQATPAQKNQIESGLAAQGVSADLIVAIKSEKDIREEFARSYQESAEENRKALDAVTDGLTALGNSATNVANSIATILQPYIEQFSGYVSEGAQRVSQFVDRVIAAGGGVDGFMKVLNEDSPEIAALLKDLQTGLTVFAQAIDLATYGLKLIGEGLKGVYDWLDSKLSILGGGEGKTHPLKDAVGTVKDAIVWAWKGSLQDARNEGVTHLSGEASGVRLSSGASRRIAAGETAPDPSLDPGESVVSTPVRKAHIAPDPSLDPGESVVSTPVRKADGVNPTIQQLSAYYVSKGVAPAVAMGLAVNAEGETWKGSGRVKANAVNSQSGASGIHQWLGSRLKNFKASHGGLRPDQTSWQTQADFVLNDPGERDRLKKALQGVSGVGNITQALNDKFEANNLPLEGIRRATQAQQLASAYGGTTGAGVGQQINIQSMTVQANTPQEFVGGVTRQSGVQSYNSAVR
jgi:hypothetical protein